MRPKATQKNELFNTEEKKRIIANFFSLSTLQSINYILPLVTIPYLVRVIGVEKFGLLAFAQATIAYFDILVDYGFNLTAIRDVAIHRNNKEILDEIFSSVIIIRFLILILSAFILFILVFSLSKLRQDALIYFLTFGVVVGNAFSPAWFFQGLERMSYIAIIELFSKTTVILLIFTLVCNESDFIKVPLINSLGFILSSIISLIILFKKFTISIRCRHIKKIMSYAKDGYHVFISRIYVFFYSSSNIFILGLLTNNQIVGNYAIAEKIINAAGGLFNPLNQAIYPYLSKRYIENKQACYSFFKKIGTIMLIIALILFALLNIFGDIILRIVTGVEKSPSYDIYVILSFAIILFPFGPLFTQILIIQKRNKEYLRVVKNAFFLNILLSTLLILLFNSIGAAISIILTYLFVVILSFYSVLEEKQNVKP